MKSFSKHIEFRDGVEHGMRPGFALSNWYDGTWEVADNLLCQRRDRLAELDRRAQIVRETYGDGVPWIRIRRVPFPAMVAGERDWADYEVRAELQVSAGGRAGIAFRWEDARHCYYLFLENGKSLALYRREQDDLIELARAPFPHDAKALYTLVARVKNDMVECAVEGGPAFTAKDASWSAGLVALVAECPAEYRSLHVEGMRHAPQPAKLPAGCIPKLELTVPLPPSDSEPGAPSLYVVNGKTVLGRRLADGRQFQFIDTNGKQIFTLGPWEGPLGGGLGTPIQFFDINGDGRDEAVLVADGRIRICSADTGAELASCELPPPNVYGEAVDGPENAIVQDALCPVRLGGEMGFYIKDRYWNIHLYNSALKHLWHLPLNTGHTPLPIDIDGDGRDEIMCGHSMLDADGHTLWKLPLEDHMDEICYLSLVPGGVPQLYLTAGEEGVLHVEPRTGKILAQHRLGHIQGCYVGHFLPGRPGLQLLLFTCWREPSIYILLDENLREAARWEEEPSIYKLGPCLLPWGDRDLFAGRNGIIDPLTGDTMHELEGMQTPLGHMVADWPGVGASRYIRAERDRLMIYGPSDGKVRYRSPVRPINIGYLPFGPLAWSAERI